PSPSDADVGIKHWNVYRNTGSGFAARPVQFRAPVRYLARSVGARLVYGLFDINADSLPDLVFTGDESGDIKWGGRAAWTVYLNQGDGVAQDPVEWPVDAGVEGLPNFLNLRGKD